MADIIPLRRKAKATAAQDCKGYVASRELLEQCEASGQMTPEQAYAHWLAGEIGNRRDGGHKFSGDDTVFLCQPCDGHCPSGDYCHQEERFDAVPTSLIALVVCTVVSLACFAAWLFS